MKKSPRSRIEGMEAFWRGRPVFVTGATGLLGTELVRRLLERGAQVVALIRDEPPALRFDQLGLRSRVIVVRGELEDLHALRRTISEYEIQSVFHLAAQTIVGTAERDPLSTFEANIQGTVNVLEACRAAGSRIREIIVASSDKAYGEKNKLPYREDASLEGRGPYDVSKSCADLLARSYAFSYDLPVAVTRCGNFFGPGDLNFNRIVPGTIRSFLQGERPVIRSDGKYVRDYLYAGDGADAYILLASLLQKKKLSGEAFNFSYGRKVSVLQMVALIAERMGARGLKPVIQGMAAKEIRAQFLSSEKAERVLGWRPTFDFERGLDETILWYKDYLGFS